MKPDNVDLSMYNLENYTLYWSNKNCYIDNYAIFIMISTNLLSENEIKKRNANYQITTPHNIKVIDSKNFILNNSDVKIDLYISNDKKMLLHVQDTNKFNYIFYIKCNDNTIKEIIRSVYRNFFYDKSESKKNYNSI